MIKQEWAAETVTLFSHYFAGNGNGGTFLDLGANIGLIIVPVLKQSAVRGVAIEADPGNFLLLQTNLLRNGVAGRVDAHNVAVFSQQGSVEFEISPDNYGDHRVRMNGVAVTENYFDENKRRTIQVPSNRLDATKLAAPVAMKIDIQGSEPFVFAGGRRVLDATDLLLIEFWPYGVKCTAGRAEIALAGCD